MLLPISPMSAQSAASKFMFDYDTFVYTATRKRLSIPSGTLSEKTPNTFRTTSDSSWLGSPPPSISSITEESPFRDGPSSEDRTNSELDVTSLPDISKNQYSSSVDSLGTLDTLNSKATDVQN